MLILEKRKQLIWMILVIRLSSLKQTTKTDDSGYKDVHPKTIERDEKNKLDMQVQKKNLLTWDYLGFSLLFNLIFNFGLE